jgi:hypothetical protein
VSQRFFFVDPANHQVPASSLSFSADAELLVITPTDGGQTITVSLTMAGQQLAFPPDAGGMRPTRPQAWWGVTASSPAFQPATFQYPPTDGDESDATVHLQAAAPAVVPRPSGGLVIPTGYNPINWQLLDGVTVLPHGGDIIALSMRADTAAPVDPNSFRVELSAGPSAKWWKGFHLSQPATGIEGEIDLTTELFTLVGREFWFGADTNMTVSLSRPFSLADVIGRGRAFLLDKAMFLGFHTHMYALDPRAMPLFGGSILSINWISQGVTFPP